MVFSSLIFLWLFLPVAFALNYIMKPQYSNIFLLLASLFFYAWGEPYFVFLMAASIVVSWIAGIEMGKHQSYRMLFFILGVAFNVFALGYYKYAGFLIGIMNQLAGREVFSVPEVALPIGISFFTFQAISYLADVFKGEAQPQAKLSHVALYIAFFPQLIAGPIVKYRNISRQIEERCITDKHVEDGFRRFIYGLSKKVLVSNVLGKSADAVFLMDVVTISGRMAWIAALLYTFQIYYDFSGYSDMAIGLGKMFGFEIPENFDYPYLSRNVSEFWRKWHISLGMWFREYVYIPLGGNRNGKGRTYVNLLVVFFLTGLWHGADAAFIVWGMYHGFFVIMEKASEGLRKLLDKSKAVSHIYLFLEVNFGWVIFRIGNLKDGLLFIKRMLMPWQYSGFDVSPWHYCSCLTVFIFICAVFGMGIIQRLLLVNWVKKVRQKHTAPEFLYCSVLLILCITALAGSTYNPFIYFQF